MREGRNAAEDDVMQQARASPKEDIAALMTMMMMMMMMLVGKGKGMYSSYL